MAVDLSFFRSETSQRLRAEGRAEGRAQDILIALEERGIDVSDDAREHVAGCHDLDTLETWFRRAITATSVDELFVED